MGVYVYKQGNVSQQPIPSIHTMRVTPFGLVAAFQILLIVSSVGLHVCKFMYQAVMESPMKNFFQSTFGLCILLNIFGSFAVSIVHPVWWMVVYHLKTADGTVMERVYLALCVCQAYWMTCKTLEILNDKGQLNDFVIYLEFLSVYDFLLRHVKTIGGFTLSMHFLWFSVYSVWKVVAFIARPAVACWKKLAEQ
jgi:hypothetical protein